MNKELQVSDGKGLQEEPGKYTSEEINIGHSIRPTPEEIDIAKAKEEEVRKAIEAKEKEVR